MTPSGRTQTRPDKAQPTRSHDDGCISAVHIRDWPAFKDSMASKAWLEHWSGRSGWIRRDEFVSHPTAQWRSRVRAMVAVVPILTASAQRAAPASPGWQTRR